MNFVHVVSVVVMMICLEIQAQNFTCPYANGVMCRYFDACCPASDKCLEVENQQYLCVPISTPKPDNYICEYPNGVRCLLGKFCCPQERPICFGVEEQMCI